MTNPPSTSLFENYINKGLSGLANIGNTCYLNSCIQVLSHTYEFNQFLKKGEYKQKLNKITDSIILLEWDKLREMLWSANCTVAPYGFVKSMQRIAKMKNRDIFSGYAQNDMQEFLLFLIDCFHNALAREVDMEIVGMPTNTTDQLAIVCYDMMRTMYKKEYSEMLSIFYGIQVSEITAFETQATLSARPEPFSVLSLSIPDEANKTMHTLYDCFDLYCTPEDLTQQNGNAWFNDKTQQKEDVQRGISFWSLPEILIIDLKRWHGHKSKLHMKIDAPLTNADFTKYVKGYQKNSYIYDLYGVCNHSGTIHGGHYTAYIKNANGKWYEFNDTSVNEIKEETVVTPRSYCFFYRKKK
jgi:ubiquitin carboxyl-terminal hydrolase 8